jgi:uncharacterized OB-fold protein
MGFEEFGIVSFTSQTKVNRFVDRLHQGRVSGSQCKKCGIAYFPPRADCCGCLSNDMEWFDIVETGKLISYSTLSYAPTGFEKDLPYTLALVHFGGRIQVFGRLSKSIKPEEIALAMDLRVSPVKLPNDRIAYQFTKP